MKDETPRVEGDVAQARRDALRERNILNAREAEAERVSLTTDAIERRKRERYERSLPVARDILEEARVTLAVHFRFLDQALWRMPLVANYDIYGISSDGRNLVYDPVYVVDRFKLSPNEVVRDVVHCLFHCIFRHPFMLYSVLRQPWDVACDIAIESMLLELVGEAFPSNMDRRAKDSLRVLRAQAGGLLTAERLYNFFAEGGNHIDFKSLAPLFYHDSHGLWYGPDDEEAPRGEVEAQRRSGDEEGTSKHPLPQQKGTEELDAIAEGPTHVPRPDDAESSARGDMQEDASASDGSRAASAGEDAGERAGGRDEEALAQEWEELSRRIQVELETRLLQQGEGAGNLVAQLSALNREKHDYAQFLRRFATLHERMKVNDDEFDYIYYTFGLKRYGNMPLIEPLEYKEDRQVHDFAIAIDTSESCSGEVVQAFMRKTYNMLKQSESFSSRVNVHVIQCDARVQSDVKITSLEQLELYLEDMQLVGFGGTDFRPVFNYVDLLIEKGEFADLRGMVYFTDGEGVFPRRPPSYDVAFAFLDDGYTDPAVPPWAYKVLFEMGADGA